MGGYLFLPTERIIMRDSYKNHISYIRLNQVFFMFPIPYARVTRFHQRQGSSYLLERYLF